MNKKRTSFAILALFFCAAASAATTGTPWSEKIWQLKLDAVNIGTPFAGPTGEADCKAQAHLRAEARTASGNYFCHGITGSRITFTAAPPPCGTQPSTSTATIACAAGQAPPWQQTTTVSVSAPPVCAVTITLTPQTAPPTACQPIVVPTGPTLYFSDCQAGAAAGCVPGNNSNPGTQALPKRTLDVEGTKTMAAGTTLLFARGGAWDDFVQLLENPNSTAAAPLVFDAYGSGPAPWMRNPGTMFYLGGGWGNENNDGGYVIRNLKLDGMGTADFALWFVQNVRDVVAEGNEITGFRIGINSNDGAPFGVRGITLRNNNIHHNRAMGMLGHYDDLLLDGNTFEANNFSGSTFDHGIYLGGGNNITIRNNLLLRNSAVNGQCTGGNMTFHGQIDGLLIEGNRIEQDSAAPGCWLMSITRGYASAEWFLNAVVRNNRLINGGNTVLAAQSAPGILIEGNVVVNGQATSQTAFAVGSGSTPTADGDVGDTNAIVRNNTVCRTNAGAGGTVVNFNSPGGSATNNLVRTGADATTGPCAP